MPGRTLSPGILPCRQTLQHPYGHRHGCSCPCQHDEGVPTLPSPRTQISAPSQAPLLLPTSHPAYGLQDETRETNTTLGQGKRKTVSVRAKYYLPPPHTPSNAKRNIKEISFLERLKGSNKSSSVSRQRFPSPPQQDGDASLADGISPSRGTGNRGGTELHLLPPPRNVRRSKP